MGCSHPETRRGYGVVVAANGARHVARYCTVCQSRTSSMFLGRAKLKRLGISVDRLTTLSDNRQDHCDVCGTYGTELHHWAPRHLFGREADDWPTGLLCVPCHRRWHALVTPNMSHERAS